MNSHQRIVPGISVNPSGQATIDATLKEVLFDLAVALEEPTNLPVDIEHVVAAIVLAARKGEIDANQILSANDLQLMKILEAHVQSIFAMYGGQVGDEDVST